MMRKTLAVVALAIGTTSSAQAAVFYEPFDYPTGNLGLNVNPSNGQTWYSTAASPTSATEDRIQVVSGSLSAPTGLPASTGNMVSLGGPGRSDRIYLGQNHNSSNTTSVYYSLLIRVTDLTGTLSSGATLLGFNNTPQNPPGTGTALDHDVAAQPSVISGRLLLKPIVDSTSTFQLGAHKSAGATADFIFTDVNSPYNVNDTIFVVGKYTFGPDAGDDTFDLWVNPSSSTFADDSLEPAPTLHATAGGDTNQIATFLLRQFSGVVPGGIDYDEIRVDTSWAHVTSNLIPEPASLGLLGATALLLRRRRNC